MVAVVLASSAVLRSGGIRIVVARRISSVTAAATASDTSGSQFG